MDKRVFEILKYQENGEAKEEIIKKLGFSTTRKMDAFMNKQGYKSKNKKYYKNEGNTIKSIDNKIELAEINIKLTKKIMEEYNSLISTFKSEELEILTILLIQNKFNKSKKVVKTTITNTNITNLIAKSINNDLTMLEGFLKSQGIPSETVVLKKYKTIRSKLNNDKEFIEYLSSLNEIEKENLKEKIINQTQFGINLVNAIKHKNDIE